MHKLLPSAATRIPRAGDKTSPYERRNSEARCRQSCWGWGEVLQSGREHIGRAWKEEACNLRSFWRRTLEVSQRGGFGHSSRLYITASVLLGGEPNMSVLLRAFFALLSSAVTSSGELAGQPGAGVCASRRSGWLKASTFCCSGCASAKRAPSLVHGQAQTSFWK